MSNDVLSHLPAKPINVIYYRTARFYSVFHTQAFTPQIMGALHTLRDVFVEREFSEPKFCLNQSAGCQHFQSGGRGEEEHFAYSACGVFWVVILILHCQLELSVTFRKGFNFSKSKLNFVNN